MEIRNVKIIEIIRINEGGGERWNKRIFIY